MDVPNPGSDEALKQGCSCPVLDNAHGLGYMGVPGHYVMIAGCPLHSMWIVKGTTLPKEPDDAPPIR